jgi:hypothetical protein
MFRNQRFAVVVAVLGMSLVAACGGTSTNPSSAPSSSTEASGHASGEPTDAEVLAEVVHKGTIICPDRGVNAACLSVDGQTVTNMTRHGLLCQNINDPAAGLRYAVVSYPITMLVSAVGHYQDGVDMPFTVPTAGAATVEAAFIFQRSATDQSWNYNVAPLSDLSAPDSPGHCPRL